MLFLYSGKILAEMLQITHSSADHKLAGWELLFQEFLK